MGIKVENKGHYREVYTGIWADADFLSLSVEGKTLWFYLLTTPDWWIPGVIPKGTSEIECKLFGKPFPEPFLELTTRGMVEVAETVGLVWVVNAIRYNKPENPNQLKHWIPAWVFIPECDTKKRIKEAIRVHAEPFLERLGKPFDELFPEPLAKGFPKPINNKQLSNKEIEIGGVGESTPDVAVAPTPKPQKQKRQKKAETPLPPEWQPSESHRELAKQLGVDVTTQAERFRDFSAAKGRNYVDWDAAFRNWLRNAPGFSGGDRAKPANEPTPSYLMPLLPLVSNDG